jgi:hypothetical protein
MEGIMWIEGRFENKVLRRIFGPERGLTEKRLEKSAR